ncbi:hypothetical protein TIFTF001_008600 [Ficus carica]|uniref:Uncharacterized protein n=1 Tax=Ficus carica TaxID=3494 RepID=A0AA88D0P2_FICCA|nr:hypothetical protein TIFTF001_008600 [Ficus carica]
MGCGGGESRSKFWWISQGGCRAKPKSGITGANPVAAGGRGAKKKTPGLLWQKKPAPWAFVVGNRGPDSCGSVEWGGWQVQNPDRGSRGGSWSWGRQAEEGEPVAAKEGGRKGLTSVRGGGGLGSLLLGIFFFYKYYQM